jgi:hypothetical protein
MSDRRLYWNQRSLRAGTSGWEVAILITVPETHARVKGSGLGDHLRVRRFL